MMTHFEPMYCIAAHVPAIKAPGLREEKRGDNEFVCELEIDTLYGMLTGNLISLGSHRHRLEVKER